MKVAYPILFRGISQSLQTNEPYPNPKCPNLLFLSKSVGSICANLGTNFPHQVNIETQVALYSTCTLLQVTRVVSFFQSEIAQHRDVTRVLAVNCDIK